MGVKFNYQQEWYLPCDDNGENENYIISNEEDELRKERKKLFEARNAVAPLHQLFHPEMTKKQHDNNNNVKRLDEKIKSMNDNDNDGKGIARGKQSATDSNENIVKHNKCKDGEKHSKEMKRCKFNESDEINKQQKKESSKGDEDEENDETTDTHAVNEVNAMEET